MYRLAELEPRAFPELFQSKSQSGMSFDQTSIIDVLCGEDFEFGRENGTQAKTNMEFALIRRISDYNDRREASEGKFPELTLRGRMYKSFSISFAMSNSVMSLGSRMTHLPTTYRTAERGECETLLRYLVLWNSTLR